MHHRHFHLFVFEVIIVSTRVRWNQNEVALLIDAYIRVEDGADLGQTVEWLSQTLRKLAIQSGQEVDENYRNLNSMKMQLANVQYLFTEGEKGLSGASAVIRQMYELYKSNYAEYQTILEEAIRLTSSNASEDAFFAYPKERIGLSPRVLAPAADTTVVEPALERKTAAIVEISKDDAPESGPALLRIGKTEKLPDDRLFVNFSQDNSYLFTKPISYTYKGVLYDVKYWNRLYVEVCGLLFDDHREAFMSIMNSDIPGYSSLAFADEQNYQRMRVPKSFAPGYYIESNLDATAIVRKLYGLHRLFGLTDELQIEYRTVEGYQSSEPKLYHEIGAVGQMLEDADYDWQRGGLLLVDLTREASYAFTQPEAYEYKKATRRVNKWGKLYADLCGALFDDYRDMFMSIMNGDIPGYNTLAFADEQHKSDMRIARCFSPGFFLESNMDATSIVRRIRGLYRLFDLGENLRISYTRQGDTKLATVPEEPTEEWLIHELRTKNIPYVDNRDADGCLWIASDMSIPIPMNEAIERGYHFCFEQNGCRAFPNHPVLWTKDQPKTPVKVTTVIRSGDSTVSLDAFKRFLIQEKGFAERTAGNYWTSIRMVEAYIQRNHLDFSLIEADAVGAQRIFDMLMARPDFEQINIQRHRQFSAALVQYVIFLRQDRSLTAVGRQKLPGQKTGTETASPWVEYETVLKQAFPKGFQKESGLDMKKLRKRWAEIHEEELKDSDDTVRLQLAAHCVDTGKRWYLADLLLSEEDQKTVLGYIDRVLGSGKPVLYYSSIYASLEHQLESTVLTEDLLISYLRATCQDRYILRERYLTNDRHAQVDLSEEIKDVMLAYGRPIHTDELKRALHHLPPDQVERELHIHSDFIMNTFHMYFHESMADLTERELDWIAAFIQEELDDQGYMIGDWIQRKLTRLYPETAERLSFLSLLGVRGAVAYKLRDRFTFSGPVITPKGMAMSMIDIFAMFCQHHTPFTLDELTAFAKECDSTIYLDTVHRNCARVSEKEFVATGAVRWDIPHIDAAIALRCPGKYVSLKSIQYFDAFPYVGYPWNSYLLEQYVATVSKDFTLMHSSYAKNNTSGAIVRRDAGFESFDEALADILANASVDLEKDPCLGYLADTGYITKRKLSKINEIITRAKMLRFQKG